jgi:hypothetical protein
VSRPARGVAVLDHALAEYRRYGLLNYTVCRLSISSYVFNGWRSGGGTIGRVVRRDVGFVVGFVGTYTPFWLVHGMWAGRTGVRGGTFTVGSCYTHWE